MLNTTQGKQMRTVLTETFYTECDQTIEIATNCEGVTLQFKDTQDETTRPPNLYLNSVSEIDTLITMLLRARDARF